jgi:Restriction endonuclease
MAYFDELSDLDFEEFAADLLNEVTGLEYRAGTRGRDKGIDLEAIADDGRHVVQCKHFRDSDYRTLRSAARKEAKALAKRKLELASYRFATSRRLNHDQRKEIAGILEPWVGSVKNVYGEGDLRRHLKKHPEVERRTVKLWLRSVGQLRQSLSAASYERSRALLEETRRQLPRYVQTESFARARETLEAERVCVIAGPAGVGKTTLARMLLLDSIEAGFQPFEIVSGGLRDVWELLELDEKQVFYFDDFLGRTALFESREQDQDLVRFLRRIAQDPKRRIVLTTREYILAQAHRVSETLDLETDDSHRYLLTADEYTRREQAQIFYNHVYFSANVDATARESLVTDHRYMDVIDHPNYNPRLIEQMTGLSMPRVSEEEKADYGAFCLNVLNAPDRLWSHTFERGLGDHERALLIALMGLPVRVSVEMAETAFEAACEARDLTLTGRQFVHALAVLDDSLIASDEEQLRLINPSLIDFLRGYLGESPADMVAALRGACSFDQVEWLWQTVQRDGRQPPERLWPEFLGAFERLMDASGLVTSVPREPRNHSISPLGRRVRIVADLLGERSWREGASSWLPSYAQRWWEELVEGSGAGPDFNEVALLLRLLEYGMLDDQAWPTVKSMTTELDDDEARWKLLGKLCRIRPELFSEEEKARNRVRLQQFIDQVFETVGESVRSTIVFDELIEAADFWDLALDPVLVAERRTEMQEFEQEEILAGEEEEEARQAEREANWRADSEYAAEMAGAPTPEEEDEYIESMFARLVAS